MAVLPIRLYPDPILRVKCAPVERFDNELSELAEAMVETMVAAPGVGLAAPQVGVELRLAVVDVSVGKHAEELRVLVNPQLLQQVGREVEAEACLSLPGISERVARPTQVKLQAQNLAGKTFEFSAEGFEARAICHELDHLDGILFYDHVRGLRRDRVRRQLRRLARSG